MKMHYSCSLFLDLALDMIERISFVDSRQAYEIMCQTLSQKLNWDYAEVWLRDDEKPMMYHSDIHYTTDDKSIIFSQVNHHLMFEFGEGLPGLAWQNKEPLWITNIEDHEQFFRKKEAQVAGFHTCFVAPIVIKEYVDAIIMFFSRNEFEENTQLIKLMQILTSRIGLNIIKKQLESSFDLQRQEVERSIELISKLFSLRDPYTISHEIFVKKFAKALGEKINFNAEELTDLINAAALHDIGKIAIPMEILSKPSKLTKEEFDLMKTHVITGYQLLYDLTFNEHVKRMVLEHHERIDGSGYPYGIKGDDIYIGSKVLAISDVVSAMMENRPYRVAHPVQHVIDELSKNAGIKYDYGLSQMAIAMLNEHPNDYFKKP